MSQNPYQLTVGREVDLDKKRPSSRCTSSDTLTGVSDADYKPPFPLTAKFNKLTIKIDRPKLSPEDIKMLGAAMREKAKAD
jgi:hypothetical protein